jgi:hypothetical protein
MIYAATKPIEEYDVMLEGCYYGLFASYGHNPELLAFIMAATPIPYDYEGDKPAGKRQVDFKNIDVFTTGLKELLDGRTVGHWLREKNPLELYELITTSADTPHLSLVKDIFSGKREAFEYVVGARAAAWGLNFKGKMASEGNVTKVNFGGTKSTIKVPGKLVAYHQHLKEWRDK